VGRQLGDYNEDYFLKQTPGKMWLKLLGVAIVVALSVGGVAFACNWVNAGAQVISPQNVKAQWQFAYDYDEALRGVAQNWCAIRMAESEATDPDVRAQRTSQRLAVEMLYATRKAEYDAQLRDAFRARLVKPADVPDRAPTLRETLDAVGCTIS